MTGVVSVQQAYSCLCAAIIRQAEKDLASRPEEVKQFFGSDWYEELNFGLEMNKTHDPGRTMALEVSHGERYD